VHLVYLGLGSNIGDREAHLQAALAALHQPKLLLKRLSSVYETAPMYVHSQAWFLNLVVEAETDWFPLQLLARAAAVESSLGRKRIVPKGPRSIDVDILFYGRFVVHTPKLEIPHPRVAERRFVLEPMAELAPDLHHPVLRRTMREMLAAVANQSVRKTSIQLHLP
jgi:2-amino-4-hydroxy-6-hydroxymethyldihydropteridine diphosphokinase